MVKFKELTSNRKLHLNLTDDEYIKLILKEINELNERQKRNPDLCSHCTTISLCEKYEELKKIGYL